MEMMKPVFFSYILVLITIYASPSHSAYYSRSAPYQPIQLQKTHLRFFFHDILGGANPTVIQITGPKDENNPIPFGTLFAIDDRLTKGPEITSKVFENAQGMYLSSSQDENLTLVMYIDLGFTTGKLEGSSLGVFSRNPITESRRELAVVGGRGQFRMAGGTVFTTTRLVNITCAILEYNVEVVHP